MSRFFIPVFLIIMFLMSCGDDGSSARSYEQAFETSSSLRDDNKSSSVDNSSSSQTIDKSSSSIKNGTSSSTVEKKNSSSSKVLNESSCSMKNESSSSSVEKENSSGSIKNESSSSSVKTEESSSSKDLDKSSSSIKNESSSSSVEKENSSSSIENESSSSSVKTEESSSSLIDEKSSSSIQSSSSMNSIYDAVNNTLTDLRDNRFYKTVTIGEQIWMAENLNYMPEDTAGTIYSGGTVCGGGAQNSKEDSEKCDIFGRLYLRKVALNKTTASNRQGICPDGWSIPKKEDWEKLISHLGENVVLKIKGDSWESTPGTNESGFSAIPAGNYNNSVIGYDNLSRAYFFYWNSKSDPYFLRIRDEENDLYYSYGASYMMYSVRCIKD